MFYVGACPIACPNGFSLQDDALTSSNYNWDNRPKGVPLTVNALRTLTTDPLQKWQNSGWTGKLYTTSWNVTSELLGWYNSYYTHPEQPKPLFRMVLNTKCQGPGPYINLLANLHQKDAPGCSALSIPAGNVRLRIEYQTLPLVVGDNILNTPGVPGFAEGVFETTAHQHDLATYAGFDRWRGVAIRGNHQLLDPNPTSARLSLQILAWMTVLLISPKAATRHAHLNLATFL